MNLWDCLETIASRTQIYKKQGFKTELEQASRARQANDELVWNLTAVDQKLYEDLPEVISAIMDVFDPTSIDNLFTTDYRALHISNNKPKLCHSTVVLSPSIKPHVGILIQAGIPDSVTCWISQIALCVFAMK